MIIKMFRYGVLFSLSFHIEWLSGWDGVIWEINGATWYKKCCTVGEKLRKKHKRNNNTTLPYVLVNVIFQHAYDESGISGNLKS